MFQNFKSMTSSFLVKIAFLNALVIIKMENGYLIVSFLYKIALVQIISVMHNVVLGNIAIIEYLKYLSILT